MKSTEVTALFTLAGIEVLQMWKLQNQYFGDYEPPADAIVPSEWCEGKTLLERPLLEFANVAVRMLREPWWLVRTKAGLISIGWRKRVLAIDWTATTIRVSTDGITPDNVTKDTCGVHAWSHSKAVEYLSTLAALINKTPADEKEQSS